MADSSLKRDSPHQGAGQGGADARAWAHDLKTTVKQARARATVVRPTSDTELVRHVKLWHASQGDRLPHQQCNDVVAALQGCSGWSTLLQESSGPAALDGEALRPATDRLKQFGYTAEAATALISFVIERLGADEAHS